MLREIENKIQVIQSEIEKRQDLSIEEIEKFEKELAELETEKAKVIEVEERRSSLLDKISAGAGTVIASTTPMKVMTENTVDAYGTIEYRNAFRNFVSTGTPIPIEYRADASTTMSDVNAVIPTTIVNKVVEKLEQTGELLNLVTRTSIKAGMSIAVENLKPTATWTGENKKSDKQKKTLLPITFGAYKLRCAVGESLEVSVLSLDTFEQLIVKNITQAMVRAIEESIIDGVGTASPKGITKETFTADQTVTVSTISLEVIKKVEKSIPLEYEDSAVWVLSKDLFTEITFLTDTNGRLVATEDLNAKGFGKRKIFGRPVVLTNRVTKFETAVKDDIVGFVGDMSDYIFNTNYEMTLSKYVDNETDENVTKAVMLCDGKLARKDSFIILKKGE